MEIEKFIPYYPSINDKNFFQEIYDKKEFKEEGKNGLLTHQQFIARFLSPSTLYTKLLLYHKMGTGKTCAAIAAIELARKQLGKKIKGIYISSQELGKNFVNEVFKCTGKESSGEFRKDLKFVRSQNYEFYTYYNAFNKKSRIKIHEFKNSYIIIDEIHTLRNKFILKTNTENFEEYNYLKQLIKNSKNCKFLLLSATPMVDNWMEIIDILNLIKDVDVDKKFRDNKLLTNSKLQIEFGQHIKGYVSFLNTGAFVNSKYNGDLIVGPSKLIIQCVRPKKLQCAGYIKAFNIDKDHKIKKFDSRKLCNSDINETNLIWGKELNLEKTSSTESSGIYSNSIQASLFVWNKSEKLYLGNSKKKILVKNKTFWLKNLSNYSAIYSEILQKILSFPAKKHFIYLKKVKGSGSELLYKILRKCNINCKYIETQKDTRDFNIKNNMYQVAIGTARIALGFTLRNIEYVHIAEPDWNYPPIAQAIGRTIRYDSHDKKTTVKIFLYALIIPKKKDYSVNYLQYKKCSEKLYKTKLITEILQKNSIDCQNFKKINNTKKCVGITDPNQAINYLTWNLYYTSFEEIAIYIKKLFNRYFILTIDEIMNKLPQYNKFELEDTLSKITSENIIIYNRWGFQNYLRCDKEIFFLVIDKFSNENWTNIYYAHFVKNNPLPIENNKILDILFANQCNFIINTFENNENIRQYFKNFSLNIQEKILQYILIHPHNKFQKFSNWLKTEYNNIWIKNKSTILVYLQHLKNNKFPIKEWNGKKWIDSKQKINFGKEIYKKFIKINKFIGVQKNNKLIILDCRNIRKLEKSQGSKKLRGIACSSIKDKRWTDLLKFLKINNSGTRKQLCNKIKEKLQEKNLIINKNEQDMLNIYMKDNKLAFFQT